jgi:hypothetical protein
MSLLGAAWTLGSIAHLSSLQALHSLTYFQITGPLGIMPDEAGAQSKEALPHPSISVFPVYHLFAWLAGFPMMAPVAVSDTLRMAAIALFNETNVRVLVANLTPDEQVIGVHAEFESATWKTMDNESILMAMTDPEAFQSCQGKEIVAQSHHFALALGPYAIGLLSGSRFN